MGVGIARPHIKYLRSLVSNNKDSALVLLE